MVQTIEERRAYQRQYYQLKKEKRCEYQRNYYLHKCETDSTFLEKKYYYNQRYFKKNKDKILNQRNYVKTHGHKSRAKNKTENISKQLKVRKGKFLIEF